MVLVGRPLDPEDYLDVRFEDDVAAKLISNWFRTWPIGNPCVGIVRSTIEH